MNRHNKHSAEEHEPADEELIRMAQQGSLEAFTHLYERYLPMVYNRVRYVVPEQDVEDVTQEIFIAVLKSLKGFKSKAKFSTWLRTLTNRRVADYYRKRGPVESQLVEGTTGVMPHPQPAAGARIATAHLDERIMLRGALSRLPDQYQDILLLRFAEGLKFHEIAGVYGHSLEATKSLFRRAISALRKEMGERND
jgi:RNA polymerase sigma factor (sigma-70 family)